MYKGIEKFINAWMVLFLFIPLVGMSQPDADPSRFFFEKDWTTWKVGIRNPDRVKKLYIADQDEVDFLALKSFTQLEGIIIRNTPLKDLTFFVDFPGIKIVELHGNGLRTLKGIEHLPLAEEIAVDHNFVKDLSPLANLTSLKFLNLYDNEIEKIDPLRNLTQLTHLDLSKNQFTSLEPICGFNQLIEFSIFECRQLADITCIKNFIHLRYLNISKLEIPHFSLGILTHMDSLNNLRIQGMVKNSEELNFIRHMVTMEQLTMGRNPGVTNIDSLKYLVNLEYLDIHGCSVEDISVVYYFPKLAKLVCYNNEIKHVEPLETMTELRALFIYNNPIEDISPIFDMVQLQYLNIGKAGLPPGQAEQLSRSLPKTKISWF